MQILTQYLKQKLSLQLPPKKVQMLENFHAWTGRRWKSRKSGAFWALCQQSLSHSFLNWGQQSCCSCLKRSQKATTVCLQGGVIYEEEIWYACSDYPWPRMEMDVVSLSVGRSRHQKSIKCLFSHRHVFLFFKLIDLSKLRHTRSDQHRR